MAYKKRLVHSEYIDARYLYAAMHVFKRMEKHQERWNLTENGWQIYSDAIRALDKAVTAFESTVSEEDKNKLFCELNNSDIYLHTRQISMITVDDNDMVFLTRNEMKDIIGYALDGCQFCDKSGKDALKCKKRKVIHKSFPYDIPALVEDSCLWSDYAVRSQDASELMRQWTWEDAQREKAREEGAE